MTDTKIIYRILDAKSGEMVGSYSRAYHDESEFPTAEAARNANVHGIFRNRYKYRIAKYRVTYELLDGDVKDDSDACTTPLQ